MSRSLPHLVFILIIFGLRHVSADPTAAQLPPDPSQPTPIFPKAQIQPGMDGVTYTVLKGNEIVPIHTVVEGIQVNAIGPGLDLIIAKLDDPKTELVEAVHGMSGSPLYINGKLAGALSHGIASFIKDGQCGFTPIEDMLQVKAIMDAQSSGPASSGPLPLPDNLHFTVGSSSGTLAPLAAPLSISGVSPGLFEKLLDRLNPNHPQWLVVPGGEGESVPDKEASDLAKIRAGSPLAVVFMAGSFHMGGTGTCTWREGNKILAFGHPMLGLGNCEYPMAESTIISTIPSFDYPYKLSNLGPIVGTIKQDRAVAIAGELGSLPQMATYQVNLSHDGQPDSPLHGTFITDPDQLPVMMGTVLLGGLEQSVQMGHKATIRVNGQLVLQNHPPLLIDGFYSGDGTDPLITLAVRSLEPLAVILGRKDEQVTPVSLVLNMDRSETHSSWSIDAVQTDATLCDPGADVQLQIRFKADFGGYQTRSVFVTLPETVRHEVVRIRLGSSGELDSQTLGPAVQDARSIDQIIQLYNARRKTNRLYIQVIRDTAGLVVKGHPMPDLPASVREVMTATPSTDQPNYLNQEVLSETSTEIPGEMNGSKDVFVQVR